MLVELVVLIGFPNIRDTIPAGATSVNTAGVTSPALISIDPTTAPNDLDTPVVITGSDLVNISAVYLGETQLTQVGWVSSTTLNATVPWGMDAGIYTLKVVNQDGGEALLADAFTVTEGIGQWNGGELYGGCGSKILLKPGDPNTMYVVAESVGLFRSRDAGETWKIVSADMFTVAELVTYPDPDPDTVHDHTSWLYSPRGGLHRSEDEGDTWTLLFDTWPEELERSIGQGGVYISPHTAGKLFYSSRDVGYPMPYPVIQGLITSDDDGETWTEVLDLAGVPVSDLDFHPTDPMKMVLATSDGDVYQSTDGGVNWDLVPSQPSINAIRIITYNPFNGNEVWVAADLSVGAAGIYKSNSDFSSWQNVTPEMEKFVSSIKFTGANTVYLAEYYNNIFKSEDGGLTWQSFGGALYKTTVCCDLVFPDLVNFPQTVYIGDAAYGIKKSTDGGLTWQVKNQGLTALYADDLSASPTFPQRIYGVFRYFAGIYRSADGATSWNYFPIPHTYGVGQVREDPHDPQRVYAAGPAFYVSENGGQDWMTYSWGTISGAPYAMEPDPFQSGRLLAGLRYGNAGEYIWGQLLVSEDHGQSWDPITVAETDPLYWITDIAYHPDIPGLVYLSTDGSGLYRSIDYGENWERIDDRNLPDMEHVSMISIATHPQPTLIVGSYRSLDGGDTWEAGAVPPAGAVTCMTFLGEDSTRLYAGTWYGLFLARDGGQTWKSWVPAAGALGSLHITDMDEVLSGGRSILYASTTGGVTGSSIVSVITPSGSLIAEINITKAGVYRYVRGTAYTLFLPSIQH